MTAAGLAKKFGGVTALAGVDVDLPAGSTTALLGPSGCGKTTLLRIIAGFEKPDLGTVSVGSEMITGPGIWKPAERRSIGYVAQEGALFPHLDVRRNIEFALSRQERRSGSRLAELLDLVSLESSQLQRFPHELSGGQQQRVALARALARRPGLVLLDEPFAALDAGLRSGTRDLVAAALAVEKVTTLLVTHDQQEALSFADRVVVMRDGRVVQTGTPREVYSQPANRWSAAFLGDAVELRGTVRGDRISCALGLLPLSATCPDGEVTVVLRPEQLLIDRMGDSSSDEAPVIAQVVETRYFGHDSVVGLRLAADPELRLTVRTAADVNLGPGTRVTVRVRGAATVVGP
ncbi:iron(III) transport system ATP-binding protein [Nakamurella sp. UYEF19]